MIYLDNSATTRPSEGVIAAMSRALSEGFYNPSSAYAPALGVEKQLDACRDKILKCLNARAARVIFTSGGTESNNLMLSGTLSVSRPHVRVAISAVEHPSIYDAAVKMCQGRAELVILPVTGEGTVDLQAVENELKKGLTLLSVMQVNNETGAINDIQAISALKNRICPACRLHVDGVQGFLREDIDFNLIDMYSLSAHKIHSAKGTGALVVKRNLRLEAAHVGGGQEEQLRSGTENTPGIIALSRAIDEMCAMTDRRDRMMALKLSLCGLIKDYVPASVVNGPAPEKGACHILNMSFPGVRGETMLHALEEKQVLVSTGSACSSKRTKVSRVLSEMGIPFARAESAIRFSLSPYTTQDDIAQAAEAVKACYETLVRFQRR